jgi:hypothetical protein
MEMRKLLVLSCAAFAAGAFTAKALSEGPQERKAREMCTETAEDGAYPRWSVKDGATCKNSDVSVCTIVRKDGEAADFTCPAKTSSSSSSSSSGGSSSGPRPVVQD